MSEPRERAAVAAPPGWQIWAALLVVYVVWGSTYLAIRIVVEALPPLASAGVRFLIAGAVVAVALALRSGLARLRNVRRAELAGAALVGLLLLFGGNGLVSLGEQSVPSALAALIIASVPLWVVVLRRLVGQTISPGTLVGVLVGFGGVALMVVPAGLSGSIAPAGLLTIVLASASWASGSFLSTRLRLPRDPFVLTAYEMIAGGAVLLIVGLAVGETFDGAAIANDPASVWALAYLVVFGSLLAFTAYTWLLQVAPISRVATYAYVNPVVAVVLGWLILGEQISPAMLVGGAIIVLAVAIVIRQESGARESSRADAAPPVHQDDPDAEAMAPAETS
ncbi:MAG: EamA family transporter [Candidatus Limnocylindrales bacterium]